MKHVAIYKETGREICSLKADIYNADGRLYETTRNFLVEESSTNEFLEAFKLWLDNRLKEPYTLEVNDI